MEGSSSTGVLRGAAAAGAWPVWLSRVSVTLGVICVVWSVFERLLTRYILATDHLLLLAVAAFVFAIWVEISLVRSK